MNTAILLHLDGTWTLAAEGRLQNMPEYPRLQAPAIVLTDFGGAVSGVSTIHENRRYAAALIGRRLRDDGLIDNAEPKVLIHHGTQTPGGWQALYTAMPMAVWQRMQSWLGAQGEHCLAIAQTALMQRLIRRDGEGVVFHAGTKICVLMRWQNAWSCFSTRVRGDAADEQRAAVRTLAERFRQEQALPAQDAPGQTLALCWYAFGAPDLASEFAAHSGVRVTSAGTEDYLLGDGASRRLPLGALVPCLSERIAVNPPLARASHFAERHLDRFSLCAGVTAAAIAAVAALRFVQASAIDADAARVREETRQIAESAPAGAAALSPDFLAARDFIDLLADARSETDPYDFLRNLRLAAGSDVKLLRVYMRPDDRHFVIEGWVDTAVASDRRLADFLRRLRRLGFSPEAVDASLAPRARAGASFAYRLFPSTPATGEKT
jgi:hypothetical protein